MSCRRVKRSHRWRCAGQRCREQQYRGHGYRRGYPRYGSCRRYRNCGRHRQRHRYRPYHRLTRDAAFPRPGPFWDAEGVGEYTLEYSLGGLFAWASMPGEAEPRMGLGGGGVLSIGFRHRRRYKRRTPAQDLGLAAVLVAIPTFGLILVPKVVLLGTDRGLDVKFRPVAVTDGGETQTSFALGISPVFRVSRRHSRWRWPAIVHFVLPEVGVVFRLDGRHAFYVQPFRFPVSVLLNQWLGLELEAGVWITVPFVQRPEVSVAITTSLSIVLR